MIRFVNTGKGVYILCVLTVSCSRHERTLHANMT